MEWREIKKQGSPVVWQRGLRNLQLPSPEFGISHTATTGAFSQLFSFRQPGVKFQSQGSSPSQQHGKDMCKDLWFWTTWKWSYLDSFNLLPEESIWACSLTFTYFLFSTVILQSHDIAFQSEALLENETSECSYWTTAKFNTAWFCVCQEKLFKILIQRC